MIFNLLWPFGTYTWRSLTIFYSTVATLKGPCLLFASCSPESLTVSLVDYENSFWNKLFTFPKEMYADPEAARPLLKFQLYRQRKWSVESTPDWQDIIECIVDLCDKNIGIGKVLEKANDSFRRKATKLLLFVISDSDREFNKDLPSCVPIAYQLKAKSIWINTAWKMIDVVLNTLKDKGVNFLAESLDGQWVQVVFRDLFNNPLTLYEFDKDCWSKFCKLGKTNLLRYMETFSHIHFKNIEGLSEPEWFHIGKYRNRNIKFDVDYKMN